MKNVKNFVKRIERTRKTLSCMGDLILEMELEYATKDDYQFLLEVQDALCNKNDYYMPLEKALHRLGCTRTMLTKIGG